MQQKYLTVTALTKYIKHRLENDSHLQAILIKGEISNLVKTTRGHIYFTLKDDYSQIRATMFASFSSELSFDVKEGDHVLIEAKINVYEPRGEYSLNVTKMTLDGIGELYLKYEQLKNTLEEQGYFDAKHKKPIPRFPKRIGVVTSKTGAVIQDILNTVNRRYRLTDIILYPSLVQGEQAKFELANQIKRANDENLVDVLIVGRGGGSIEDLWAFNEIEVIMAIFESKIPIISAIGHETDLTISDFVSDLRAPTPTAAAEMATPNQEDLKGYLTNYQAELEKLIKNRFSNLEMQLAQLERRLTVQSPINQLEISAHKLNKNIEELHRAYQYLLNTKSEKVKLLKSKILSPKERITRLEEKYYFLTNNLDKNINNVIRQKSYEYSLNLSKLNSINPLKTLEKGFGLITKENKVITSIDNVKSGDEITIEIIDGKIITKVTETRGKNGK